MEALQSDFEHMRINNERLQEEMQKLQSQYDMEPTGVDGQVMSPGQGKYGTSEGHYWVITV